MGILGLFLLGGINIWSLGNLDDARAEATRALQREIALDNVYETLMEANMYETGYALDARIVGGKAAVAPDAANRKETVDALERADKLLTDFDTTDTDERGLAYLAKSESSRRNTRTWTARQPPSTPRAVTSVVSRRRK